MTHPIAAQNNVPLFAYRPVLEMFWAERAVMLAAFTMAMAAALVYLHVAEPTYTAELKVTAAESQLRLPSGLGGLASLAGVSLPGGETSQLALYREVMRSREAANMLARDEALMRRVFADRWDSRTGRWRQPFGPVADLKSGAKWLLGFPDFRWHAPDAETLHRYLDNNLRLVEDAKTGVLAVAVEHSDRRVALELLARLDNFSDEALRRRALARSSDYIAYLVAKLPKITVAEQRMALVEALSQQERIRMMANASVPFSAEPLGAVSASMLPTAPKNTLVIPLGLVAGLALGALIATRRHARRRRQSALLGEPSATLAPPPERRGAA